MFAVVDMGSNTLKYLVAEKNGHMLRTLGSRSWVNRLGEGLLNSGIISDFAKKRTEIALVELKRDFESYFGAYDPNRIEVVATAAVREAKNQSEIVDLVKAILGVNLRILSGQEEAALSREGALLATEMIGMSSPLFIDVGGASTEVGTAMASKSFPVGAVKAHELCNFGRGPIFDAQKIEGLKLIQTSFFSPTEWQQLKLATSKFQRACVVGGTLVSAAEKCPGSILKESHPGSMDSQKLGFLIRPSQLFDFNQRLMQLSASDRTQNFGFDEGRADIVCAGILLLQIVLEHFGVEELFVTAWGLRHGLLKKHLLKDF